MKINRNTFDASKLRRIAEWLPYSPSPTETKRVTKTEMLKTLHELDVHQIGLEQRNEELTDAKRGLKERAKQSEGGASISERFARSMIDAFSAHLAIMDEKGVIVAVNSAWRKFALANGTSLEKVSEGVNYLAVCYSAKGLASEGAAEFATGIHAVKEGLQQVRE